MLPIRNFPSMVALSRIELLSIEISDTSQRLIVHTLPINDCSQ